MRSTTFALLAGLSLMLPSITSAELISEWDGNPIILGDKTFTLVGYTSNNPGVDLGTFTVAVDNPGNGLFYNLNVTGNMTEGTYTLSYSVTITGTNEFLNAGLSATVFGNIGGQTITEEIAPGTTLTSFDGSNDDGAIGGQGIQVTNTIVVTGDGGISNFINTFTQVATVPEPSTLALLGLGGLGFAARALRRRQTAI